MDYHIYLIKRSPFHIKRIPLFYKSLHLSARLSFQRSPFTPLLNANRYHRWNEGHCKICFKDNPKKVVQVSIKRTLGDKKSTDSLFSIKPHS